MMSYPSATEALSELCRRVLQAGVGLTLQSTLLLGLGLLVGRAVRRSGPALASLVYRAALAAALLGAAASLTLGGVLQPLWRVSLPPVADRAAHRAGLAGVPEAGSVGEAFAPWMSLPGLPGASATESRLVEITNRGEGGRATLSAAGKNGRAAPGIRAGASRGVSHTSSSLRLRQLDGLYMLLVGVWAAGALALLLWLLLCQLQLRRIRRNSRPALGDEAAELLQRLGERYAVSPPVLLVSSQVRTPFLAGVWRPAIFLPAGYETELDAAALRAILAHELVHLTRRDCAWNLLAQVMSAIGWVQPLLWLIARRSAQTSEEVCDQEVVRREGDARGYADCLLRLSERLLPASAERMMGVGVAPFRSSLGRRIQEIVERPRPRPLSAGFRALVGLGAVFAVVLGSYLIPGAALPSAGAPDASLARADRRPQSALEHVRELEKPVTYTETKISLGELVQKVGADTGVRLTAAAEVADEPVAVVVKDLPACELLEQIADLLDYRWTRVRDRRSGSREGTSPSGTREPDARTPAFQIYQDAAGKRAEAAAREAAMAAAWQRLGEQIPGYVRMAARPPAEIERLREEQKRWVDRMLQLPYAQRLAMDIRNRALRQQYMMAELLSSPVTRGEAALLGQLTSAQWALLRQGQPLIFSTDPQQGEVPLPDEISRVFHGAQPSMGNETHYGSPERQREERKRRQELKTAWAEATGYQVRIALDASRFRSDGDLSLQASAIPLHSGRPASPAASLPANGAMLGLGVGPSYVFPGGADEADEKANAARRAALEKDPVLGTKKPLEVDLKPRPPEQEYWKGVWGLGEMLPDVARIYGVSLISDAYNGDRTTTRFASATPIALYDLLDRLAGDRHVWDRHRRVVRFRYRAWPFARPQEVPIRLLRRWQTLLDRDGALPLDEWLSMATLTDLQLDTLFHWGMFRGPGAFVVPVDPRYALRLYVSLTPDWQQALQQGRPLPIARMTPAQQRLFLAALREQARERQGIVTPGSEPALGPEAALSLSRERKVWIFKQHGNWTGIRYEPVPETTGAAPAAAPRSPTPARSPITRRTITTMTFRFQSGLGKEERVFLYTSSQGITQ